MLSRISFVCASAVVGTVLSVPSFARGKTNTVHTATVTGCLAQGDEPNEYAIKTENGKIYGLSSSTVDLPKHMDHRVTVTGVVTANTEKNSTTSTGQPEEDFLMKVTNLKMVSITCQ
jgi:hypothetical protein